MILLIFPYSSTEWALPPMGPNPSIVGIPRAAVRLPSLPPPDLVQPKEMPTFLRLLPLFGRELLFCPKDSWAAVSFPPRP